jgi:hypothetical protein
MVEQLVADGAIPARKLGEEWRFLKTALNDWLRFPAHYPRDYGRMPPHWLIESPFAEELIFLLEERLLKKLRREAQAAPKPGSKQAVLKHFGIFHEDADLDDRLGDARTRREAGG